MKSQHQQRRSISSPRSDMESSDGSLFDPTKAKIISFTTDDFKVRRMVSSSKDLPLGKYTFLGAILKQDKMEQSFSGKKPIPVISMKQETFTKQHNLGPLPPGKLRHRSSSVPAQAETDPTPFAEAEQPFHSVVGLSFRDREAFNQPLPPHDGLIWPTAWAPRPPYTSPGYNRLGVRQPVGVIQVDKVPTMATRGRTDTQEFDLPTWVSPLYRPYGVGGPFGPFGPFYEPPGLEKTMDKVPFRVDLPSTIRSGDGKTNKVKIELQKIVNADKTTGDFLSIMDDNLVAMRHVIRLKKNNKDLLSRVVHNLSNILDDAKNYEVKLQRDNLLPKSDSLSETTR